MRFMLDTQLCIYTIKHRPSEVLTALRTHEAAGLGLSAITVAELFLLCTKAAQPTTSRRSPRHRGAAAIP